MSDFPERWARARLQDVCELINGRAYKQDELLERGKYPVLRVGNFFSNRNWYYSNLDLDSEKYCDSGDLLYAWSASFGPRIWDGGKVIFHYHIWKTRLVDALIEKRFLYHWFEWDKENIKSDHGTGSTMIHVTKGDMEAREFALPPPPEQRRIVAKIDSLTGKSRRARDHLDHIPRLVEKYKQAILAAAFRGDLTREWRAVCNHKTPWELVNPAAYFAWSSGKNLPSKRQFAGDVPVIGGNGIGGYHNEALIDFPTLVIGRVGAQCGNIHFSSGPAWITDNAIFARSISDRIDLSYAVLFFRNANLNQLAGGSGQPYINQTTLNALTLPLPSIEEQRELVRLVEMALNWVDRLAADATSARKLIDHLDQAVLAKAFKGELVPQDPADEPASALLERIRAERAAVPKAKRGRRKAV